MLYILSNLFLLYEIETPLKYDQSSSMCDNDYYKHLVK